MIRLGVFLGWGLTLTRTIKSVVTGQARTTLEVRNASGIKHKQTKGGACITADAIRAFNSRNIYKERSGVSVRCARSILLHTSHYLRPEKPTTRYTACHPKKTTTYLARGVYITRSTCHYAYPRQTQVNWKKKLRRTKYHMSPLPTLYIV